MVTALVGILSLLVVSCTQSAIPPTPFELSLANNQIVSTDEDKPIEIKLNAENAPNRAYEYVITSRPTHGTLSGTPPLLTYTPNRDFNGTDEFGYQMIAGSAQSNIGRIVVNVGAVADLPIADSADLAVTEDTAKPGVLVGRDPDGGPITFSIAVNGTKGTATITNDRTGAFTYVPSTNANGDDLFGFRVNRGSTSSMVAPVRVSIAPQNDGPLAVAPSAPLLATEDTLLNGTLSGTDPDGDTLTFSIVRNGSKGVATITNPASGAFSYRPTQDLNGSDTFTFRVTDGKLFSTPATVSITIAPVNDAPVSLNGTLPATEDNAASGTAQASDIDGDPLSFSPLTQGTKGVVAFSGGSSTFVYTPNANQNGSDTFTYRAFDGKEFSNSASITVTIAAVDDPPIPTSASIATDEDVVISGNLSANDSETGTSGMVYFLYSRPAHGTLTFTTQGAFSYTPAANYFGPDEFKFNAQNGQTSSAPGTISITVRPINDRPVATNTNLVTSEDQPKAAQLSGSDVERSPLTFTIVSAGTKGTAQLTNASTGDYLYTPKPNENGTDTFTFTVSDGQLTSREGTVSVTLTAVDDAPTAVADNVQILEDSGARQLRLTAADPDSDPIVFQIVSPAQKGVAVLTDPSGRVSYTPSHNANGEDAFTFKAIAKGVSSNIATFRISITPVNDPPTLPDQTELIRYAIMNNSPLTGQVYAADVDGDSLTYRVSRNAANGDVVFTDENRGTFQYTRALPVDLTQTGDKHRDRFCYTVRDSSVASAGEKCVAFYLLFPPNITKSQAVPRLQAEFHFGPRNDSFDTNGNVLLMARTPGSEPVQWAPEIGETYHYDWPATSLEFGNTTVRKVTSQGIVVDLVPQEGTYSYAFFPIGPGPRQGQSPLFVFGEVQHVSNLFVSASGVSKRMFITSSNFSANLGGTAGADEICQRHGAAAGGRWYAVIGSSNRSIGDSLRTAGPFVGMTGARIGDNVRELLTRQTWSSGALKFDERGRTLLSYGYWHTGSGCGDWTSDGGTASYGWDGTGIILQTAGQMFCYQRSSLLCAED